MTIFKKTNPTEEPPPAGLFSRLGEKLSATRETLSRGFADLLLGKKILDADLLEQLEARLLMADVGPETTQKILDRITERISRKELTDTQAVRQALKNILLEILASCAQPLVTTAPTRPFVIMVVGVNGAGKTTTIGKLTHKFKQQGDSVMLAAADTFRAAPHEVLLVLDAGNGQNILSQWKNFDAAVGVTGLCLTKLDGTAKGGVLFALAAKARLPIRYIGVGEGLEDLRDFDAAEFVEAILPEKD